MRKYGKYVYENLLKWYPHLFQKLECHQHWLECYQRWIECSQHLFECCRRWFECRPILSTIYTINLIFSGQIKVNQDMRHF